MVQRRRKKFNEFPSPPATDEQVLEDTRNMDYLSKFRDWHVRTVFYFALLGMTNEQMATALGISFSTFQAWLTRHITFREAVREGKEQADAKVVYSLYQAAVGYTHPSEQILTNRIKTYDPISGKLIGEHTEALRVPITKQYPPNVKAGIHWLGARQPTQWSQRKEVLAQVNVKHQLDLTDFTVDELHLLNKLGVREKDITDVPFVTTLQEQDTVPKKLDE